MSRLTDNDKRFGPFEYGQTSWKNYSISFETGDDEYLRNSLNFWFGNFVCRLPFKQIIKPYKRKIKARYWSQEDIDRMGRDWYYEIYKREYSISVSDGAMHLRYGEQTHDSTTDKSKCYFLPWRNYSFVRHSMYDVNGNHWKTEKNTHIDYEVQQKCPKVCFELEDYDGEKIIAETRMEERQYKLGTGYFKWLSWFKKDIVSKTLDIWFDKETGREKGSWKGGTVGHSIEMNKNELHESAMRRYCEQEHYSKGGMYKMKFIKKLA